MDSQRANYLWLKVNTLCDDLLGGGSSEDHGTFTIEEVRAAFESEVKEWEALGDAKQTPDDLVALFKSDDDARIFDAMNQLDHERGHTEARRIWSAACVEYDRRHMTEEEFAYQYGEE